MGDMSNSDAWRRWGRVAGYIAGPVFLFQTVLFLLDVTGVLAPQVGFVDTPAGVMEDLATYYAATNERMHRSGGRCPPRQCEPHRHQPLYRRRSGSRTSADHPQRTCHCHSPTR